MGVVWSSSSGLVMLYYILVVSVDLLRVNATYLIPIIVIIVSQMCVVKLDVCVGM